MASFLLEDKFGLTFVTMEWAVSMIRVERTFSFGFFV
jgi:hypothetical protein